MKNPVYHRIVAIYKPGGNDSDTSRIERVFAIKEAIPSTRMFPSQNGRTDDELLDKAKEISVKDVLDLMRDGETFYVQDDDNGMAIVKKVERNSGPYIRTERDDVETDNLLRLPNTWR